MITITEKVNCCGCFSCYNICPTQSISMIPDDEGFLYPTIDIDKCINCNLCEKHCPLLQTKNNIQQKKEEAQIVYGCRNSINNELYKSSSGGMFSLFAKKIFENQGIVIGAKFNETWNVVHTAIDDIKDLKYLIGSKYVQSEIGFIYKKIKELLKNNCKVLFIGTPCQVSGLHSFLSKKYNNLITVDFVCHGVPSPLVWQKYLKEIIPTNSIIKDINFRDKHTGWPQYCFSYSYINNNQEYKYYIPSRRNPFMRGFLHNLYLRPSCHECKFKGFTSKSDITMSDFWGVWKNYPKWNDQKGASCIAINTKKGLDFFNSLNDKDFSKIVITFKQAYIDYNHSALHTSPYNPKRNEFFRKFQQEPFSTLSLRFSKDPILTQIKNTISDILNVLRRINHN